ncbi:DUF1934 domain-containing protein [Clostridium sp. BJN0001]|uniref:DUF1934 domain-containing protein n=1 Tax=Clostridium sp. BJN0001 TaxID=2930219 RepID=UPI001FCF9AB5|nr:DUF1934 domain-containing protein [Clostridium sp. BJN0001]
MKNKALIFVKSIIHGDEDDSIEVISDGYFINKHSLAMAEYDESKVSGMEGTHTSILIKKDSFKIIRSGNIETEMEFKKKERTACLYKTANGIINIEIDTIDLTVNVDDCGGVIRCLYLLSIDGQVISRTSIVIKIKLKNID